MEDGKSSEVAEVHNGRRGTYQILDVNWTFVFTEKLNCLKTTTRSYKKKKKAKQKRQA